MENSEGGSAAAPPRSPFGLAAPFGELLVVWLVAAIVLGVGVALASFVPGLTTEATFFWRQDLPFLLGLPALLAAIGALPLRLMTSLAPPMKWPPAVWVGGLGGLCLCAGVLGAPWVFDRYTLSLDEFMANFDARIFAHGELMAPIPPAWRTYAGAMQPIFTLPVPDDAFWVSAYLPVNAAMRAAASLVHAQDLVNPLLSALGLVATYAVARRLWPADRQLSVIAVMLLATSAQLIVMGMTAYAMPAHLAFNMVWLWLFLRGGRLEHAAAIGVGFLATGLHELLFHPLFAAPFVLQLWLGRRWSLATVYTIAYAAICAIWIEYPAIILRAAGVAAADGADGGRLFTGRILDILAQIRLDNFAPLADCLVRFVTWQNPLLSPLAIIGGLGALRTQGEVRALAIGVVLTLLAALVLVPTQVHGWGYRYLHGLLGSLSLIAAWTWRRLTQSLPPTAHHAATGGLVLTSALSLLVLTPIRAWQAWAYCHPYAEANALIQGANADIVLVDDTGAHAFNAGTVVRNDPLLQHRPKVMALAALDAEDIATLCAGYKIALFDGGELAALGGDTVRLRPNPEVAPLRAELERLKCGRLLR